MTNKIEIYGFAILRNGIKYDYPFEECLKSMGQVCLKTYLALGNSDDGTEDRISKIDNLKITNTIWDDEHRQGGIVLSVQTNIALDFLRDDHKEKKNAWGLYLQCDEVIHERDNELLKRDFKRAQAEGCDAIRFRYLHFWKSHRNIAINKKWYPHEIRAVRLDSDARSWGDAQGFEKTTKVFESEVIIYHYGHVREEESYKNKKTDILKLYHSDEKMNKYKRRERRHDNRTECVPFLGKHPKVMEQRIIRLGEKWDYPRLEVVYILGLKSEIRPTLLSQINAIKVIFVSSIFEVPITHRNSMVIIKPNFFQKIWYGIKTPLNMRSKLARAWEDDFRFLLMCYEKNISTN